MLLTIRCAGSLNSPYPLSYSTWDNKCNNWFFFMDLDGVSPDIIPINSFVFHNFGGHLFSQISSFLDNSMHQSQNLYVPGSLALREAFNCAPKLAGAVLFWFSSTSTSNMTQDIASTSHGPKPRSHASSAQVKHITSRRHKILLDFVSIDWKENLTTRCFFIRLQVSWWSFGSEKPKCFNHILCSHWLPCLYHHLITCKESLNIS